MKITQKSSTLGIVGPIQGHGATLKCSPFTAIQTVRSHNSTLVQARKLILSMYVYLILIYRFYKNPHAWMIL